MVLFIRRECGVDVASEAPEKMRWYASVQLEGGPLLTLVDLRHSGVPLRPPRLHLTYPMPILKSNLQKTIRRCDRTKALRTAWQMLRQDSMELLRRIPVIIAEDTLIQPTLYTEVVWLMAAVSKGYQITWADAELVMATVATSVAAKGQYNIDVSEDHSDKPVDLLDPLSLALQIRISFGGMKYDSEFLSRLLGRSLSLPLQPEEEIAWVEEDIDDFQPMDDVLLAAIDQHVFPSILRDISGACPKMIWWCRSEPNERPYVGCGAAQGASLIQRMREEYGPAFETYRDALDSFARRKIRQAMIKKVPVSTPPVGTLDRWVKK